MADEPVVERVVERAPQTTIIEKRGSGMGVVIGILVLVAIALLAWFLFAQNRNDTVRTDAVTGAAQSVGDAAGKVGDAAEKATDGK
jgi:TRAP-type C4-dicarboxylate transport system substrate-binding protein